MVMKTSGLSGECTDDSKACEPRSQECSGIVVAVCDEKETRFIDLNPPPADWPKLLWEINGVHPNTGDYLAMARLLYWAAKTEIVP
jgi:hypothetical protein